MSSGRALTLSHVAVQELGSRVQVTQPVTVEVFVYCFISDAVSQECAFGGKSEAVLTMAKTA